jgi:hypothetical protein
MLRMEGSNYTRYHDTDADPANDPKEYYDLVRDPYQLHNALGASDTAYPPPGNATLAYYERRLDNLYGCAGPSCRAAENASLVPPTTTP